MYAIRSYYALHRNNFIAKVNAHELDSMDFYRVINKFLIQTGKDLPNEKAGLIPAEFRADLFHRRGAVNAAREGDETNPTQASADLHFTIIQGKVQNDSTLNRAEQRINEWRAYNQVINDPANEKLVTQLQACYADSTQEDEIPRITSYNVCYTKLLRFRDALRGYGIWALFPTVFALTHSAYPE